MSTNNESKSISQDQLAPKCPARLDLPADLPDINQDVRTHLGWVQVDLMSQAQIQGWGTEVEFFGTQMLRIDTPHHQGHWKTRWIGTPAISSISTVEEAVVLWWRHDPIGFGAIPDLEEELPDLDEDPGSHFDPMEEVGDIDGSHADKTSDGGAK